MSEQKTFKVSHQLCGALMIALQNGLAEESDILPELMGWILFEKDGEIWVENPPIYRVPPSVYEGNPEAVKEVMENLDLDGFEA